MCIAWQGVVIVVLRSKGDVCRVVCLVFAQKGVCVYIWQTNMYKAMKARE